MGRIENDGVQRRVIHQPQPKIEPKPKVEPKTLDASGGATRRNELRMQGQQQRDRIERLYGAGAASVSMMNEIGLISATTKANKAHQQTFTKELSAFEAYKKGGGTDPSYTGAKSYIEVTQRADNAYRAELQKAGFRSADVHGNSNVKALDFLNAEANRPGDLSTLSGDRVRLRVQSGEKPTYVVRLVQNRYIDSGDAKLSNKQTAWVATADEIAGAKGDLFETMKRIGYPQKYVDEVRQNIQDSTNGIHKPGDKKYARVEDYSLAVVETDGTKGRTTPLWDTMLDKAKTNKDFNKFDLADPKFVEKVKNFQHNKMDYNSHRDVMDKLKVDSDNYSKNFPTQEKEAFRARYKIEGEYGANPLYTGDGTTLRPDMQNRRVGGRELFIDSVPLREQRRTSFMPMRDTGLSASSTSVEVRSQINNIVDVPRTSTIRSEIKGGSLAGAVLSTVFSLPQVYDQARQGNYLGAGQTLVTNAGTGALVGGASSAGERLIGNSIEQGLSRSGTQVITSGVARQVVSRVAGSSIIGGVVNGAFSSYDQIGAFNRGEVTGSQAIGTVVGEVGIGLAAGATGAAAGAAIGSIVPIAGTAVGAVVGFVVGVGVGMATDAILRHGGVDKLVAHKVTAAIDAGSRFAGAVQRRGSQAVQAGRQFVSQQITQAKAVYRSASSAVKSARAFVGQKLDNARQRVSNATRAAVNYVSQVKDRAVQTVRNTASQAINQVRSTVNNVANEVSSTVSNIANQARSTVSNAVNNVADVAVNRLKSVFGW
jgi:F0F1-type ATP synthase membrane subunit b/b'